jgi:hypothetical protein
LKEAVAIRSKLPVSISITSSTQITSYEISKSPSFKQIEYSLELLEQRIKPIQEQINARMEALMRAEIDRSTNAERIDRIMHSIKTGRIGVPTRPIAGFKHFVKLYVDDGEENTYPYDIERSNNPDRYVLFRWLDDNCVGVWRKHSASILFSHEEDAVLFRMKFA